MQQSAAPAARRARRPGSRGGAAACGRSRCEYFRAGAPGPVCCSKQRAGSLSRLRRPPAAALFLQAAHLWTVFHSGTNPEPGRILTCQCFNRGIPKSNRPAIAMGAAYPKLSWVVLCARGHGAVRARLDTHVGRELEQIDLFLNRMEGIVPDDLPGAQVQERLPLDSDRPALQSGHARLARRGVRFGALGRTDPRVVFFSEDLNRRMSVLLFF